VAEKRTSSEVLIRSHRPFDTASESKESSRCVVAACKRMPYQFHGGRVS